MKKTDIIQLIESKGKDWVYVGDYHTIDQYEVKEIIENLDNEEYEDYEEIYDELTYDGDLQEYADNATPIYYYDLAKWFGENWYAVNDYLDEFGEIAHNKWRPDIMKTIQGAYCITYERDLTSAIELIIEELE
jgi:hypothetical protein